MTKINTQRYFYWITGFWTIFISLILLAAMHERYLNLEENATVIAKTAYEKDIMYRQWVAAQGGVYLPVSEHIQSNPYLSFTENRDIVTTKGDSLTLINPAFMTRQVLKMSEKISNIPEHLISLNPINPINTPDEFEKEALQSFENGLSVFKKLDTINNTEYLRYIKPFYTEKNCLKCHAQEGYKVGDIRGAISIAIPIEDLKNKMSENNKIIIITFFAIWFIGITILLFIFNKLRKHITAREDAEKKVITSKKLAEENLKRFKGAFENSTIGMTIVSLKGQFLQVNKSLVNILGYDEKEILTKTFQKITHPNDLGKNLELLEQMLQGKIQNYQIEKRFIHKSGEIIWTILNVSLVKNSYNQPAYFVSQIHDITHRKNSEKALKDSEEKHRLLFETMLQGVVYQDTTGRILSANNAAENILGLTLNQMQESKTIDNKWKAIHEDGSDFPSDTHPAMQALKTAKVVKNVVMGILNPKKEKYNWVNINAIPQIKSGESKPYQVYTIFEDITEKKQIEKSLSKSEEKYRLITENASDVTWILNLTKQKFTYVSPSILQLRGYTVNEAKEESMENSLTPKSAQIINKILPIRLNNFQNGINKSYSDIIQQPCKDKSVIWVEMVTKFQISKNGDTEVLGVSRNISDRKDAEQALQNSFSLLNSIIESPRNIIIFTLDTDYKYLAFNKNHKNVMRKIWGVNIKIGLQMLDIIKDKNDKQKAKHNYDRVLKGEQFTLTEEYGSKPNRFWYENIYNPVFDNKQNVIGISIFLIDITNRKETELIIKESELKFRSVINNMIDIYYRTDINQNLILASQSGLKELGYKSMDEIIGKNIAKTFYFNMDERETFINTLKKTGQVENYRVTLKHKNGQPVNFETNSKILLDAKGKLIGIEGIMRNITERIKSEQNLIKAKQEAETANRLKSEFLANMSHEIRTPMNAVLGFAEILNIKLAQKPEYKMFIEGIINGGKNLISLINDILDLSKIEAGHLEIITEPVNLLGLLNEIKQIFAVKIQNKNLQFILNIDNSLPTTLLLDQTRIRQIMFNLVGNAVKFTDIGSVTISVKVDNYKISDSHIDLYFEIKDTGIGIPQDHTEKIFEAFRQIEGQSTKYGGTGLGLPITQKLIKAMNGEISVNSKVGKGSIFRIHLKHIKIPAIKVIAQNNDKTINIQNIQFKQPTILLADDIKSNRDIVKHNLQEHNCNIIEVENGKEVIDLLQIRKVDLILMDIQMPELNGYDATKQIKEQNELKTIPIIALTGLAMKEQVEKYDDIFDHYLKKPIALQELIQTLMMFLPYSQATQNKAILNKDETYIEDFTLDIKNIDKLPNEFIEKFRNTIIPLHEEISDIMDIDDCISFGSELLNAGEKYKIPSLIKFGTKIMTYTKNFQLNKIQELLNIFENIIDNFNKKTH